MATTPTLRSTYDVMDHRKLAILGEAPETAREPWGAADTTVDSILHLFSGHDVNRDEVHDLANRMAGAAILELLHEQDPVVVLRSLYVDALAIGMLHERRCRETLDGEKIDGD